MPSDRPSEEKWLVWALEYILNDRFSLRGIAVGHADVLITQIIMVIKINLSYH